jgi:hypothetical protein
MLVLAGLDDRSSQRQEGRILIGQCAVSWSCFGDEHVVDWDLVGDLGDLSRGNS